MKGNGSRIQQGLKEGNLADPEAVSGEDGHEGTGNAPMAFDM